MTNAIRPPTPPSSPICEYLQYRVSKFMLDPVAAMMLMAAYDDRPKPAARLNGIRPKPMKASLFSGSVCSAGLHQHFCDGAVIQGSCEKCGALILSGTA